MPLPAEYHSANLRRAELTWRADHYELCLTLETGETLPPPLPAGAVAGVDLGEVHVAAVTTTRRHALVVSGRQLRAYKQWRNKGHSVLQEQLSGCQAGSRRAKRLDRRKAHLSARGIGQPRDILHQAARRRHARWWTSVTPKACEAHQRIAVGDVRDIPTGVRLGKVTDQKIRQRPHGQFARYVREKAARIGMGVEWIDEA